jgi:hypothetical protein
MDPWKLRDLAWGLCEPCYQSTQAQARQVPFAQGCVTGINIEAVCNWGAGTLPPSSAEVVAHLPAKKINVTPPECPHLGDGDVVSLQGGASERVRGPGRVLAPPAHEVWKHV